MTLRDTVTVRDSEADRALARSLTENHVAFGHRGWIACFRAGVVWPAQDRFHSMLLEQAVKKGF